MKHEKTALITGGAQGIGRAIAERLVSDGYTVFVADVDAEAIDELNQRRDEDIRSASLSPLFGIVADIGHEDDVRKIFHHIAEKQKRLDVLVNNAAIVHPENDPVAELSLENWQRVITTNLTGAFLCVKHAVPLLRTAKGAIVNIASTRALQSEPNTEAYAASKGGLVALTHALALSLGPEIRVNCVSPGWIATAHLQKASKRDPLQLSKADHDQHPVGRVGRPEDIAGLVAYLASTEAGFITGQNFVVDGGMTKKMIYVE